MAKPLENTLEDIENSEVDEALIPRTEQRLVRWKMKANGLYRTIAGPVLVDENGICCQDTEELSDEERERLRSVFPVKVGAKNAAVIIKMLLFPSVYHCKNRNTDGYEMNYFSK